MGTQLLFRGFPKLSFKSNDIRLILLPKAFAFLDRFPEAQLDDDQPRLPKRAHKQLLFVLSHSFKILLHVDASQLPALPLINRLVQILTLVGLTLEDAFLLTRIETESRAPLYWYCEI
ncbi:hypothetical protein FS842_009890 [Serendipita sp. 407]|nr:hypothetical protein FS842_009890 [Serendipita sp. 407]